MLKRDRTTRGGPGQRGRSDLPAGRTVPGCRDWPRVTGRASPCPPSRDLRRAAPGSGFRWWRPSRRPPARWRRPRNRCSPGRRRSSSARTCASRSESAAAFLTKTYSLPLITTIDSRGITVWPFTGGISSTALTSMSALRRPPGLGIEARAWTARDSLRDLAGDELDRAVGGLLEERELDDHPLPQGHLALVYARRR